MDDSVWCHTDTATDSEREYVRIQEAFRTTGYREGVIAGKEGALQASFDEGFADIGVPIGKRLGFLRGLAAAILSTPDIAPDMRDVARMIASELVQYTLADLAPADTEAEEHAKKHLSDSNLDPSTVNRSAQGAAQLTLTEGRLFRLLSDLDLAIPPPASNQKSNI